MWTITGTNTLIPEQVWSRIGVPSLYKIYSTVLEIQSVWYLATISIFHLLTQHSYIFYILTFVTLSRGKLLRVKQIIQKRDFRDIWGFCVEYKAEQNLWPIDTIQEVLNKK